MSELAAERRSTPVSVRNKIGLVLALVLGLVDTVRVLQPTPEGEQGPPFAVLAVASVLGVLTVAAAIYTWRTGNRVGARIVAGSRIISALTAVPAFFVGGVPAGLVALAAAGIVLAAICVALVLAKPKTR